MDIIIGTRKWSTWSLRAWLPLETSPATLLISSMVRVNPSTIEASACINLS